MKRTIIFGATSAIATEYAKIALERGDKLGLISRNESKLDALVTDLSVRFNLSENSIIHQTTDFLDNEAVQNSFLSIIQKMGGIDQVLVAHGTLPNQELLESEIQQVEYNHQVNYLSVVAICEIAATTFLKNKKEGQISVISSVAGDRGKTSNYFYCASKGALTIYLQGLRGRLSSANIKVLTVKPGFVDTPMTHHMPKGPLWASAQQIAKGIRSAEYKRKDVVYLPFFWWGIMLIIKSIPEKVFKKLDL